MTTHNAESDQAAACCGHHLACHDRYEDGWGPQGCGFQGCDCRLSFREAFVARLTQAYHAGAQAALEGVAAVCNPPALRSNDG